MNTINQGASSGELLQLAELVEAATGPDRELDVAIAGAVDWRWPDWEEGESTARGQIQKHGLAWLTERATIGMNSAWRGIPAYTASIDAAMTLVDPDDYYAMFSLERDLREGSRWTARFDSHGDECGNGDSIVCEAATPALALVSAALKARAAQGDEPCR